MWKTRKEDEPPVNPIKEVTPVATPTQRPPFEPESQPVRGNMAHIGKSVLVKGELSGSEDLYIDGEVEGTVELSNHNLTVGPNGRVHANLHAKEITVLGKVQGNVKAKDKLEIRKSGSLIGDIITARITIEDGAYFKGSIDIQKGEAAAGARAEAAPARAPQAASAPSPYATVGAEKKLP